MCSTDRMLPNSHKPVEEQAEGPTEPVRLPAIQLALGDDGCYHYLHKQLLALAM